MRLHRLIDDILKRFVLGNREDSVDGLIKAISVRLMAGNQPTLAELADQLMPDAKPGFRRHQIAMAAQILVNRGEAEGFRDRLAVNPVLDADPEDTRLRAKRPTPP